MLKKWLPWKFIIKRAAQAYGFIDPITLLARLRQFGQPSEVQEPLELIRAGVIFHARGLVNTRAIQYNLDWVWPFWIVKQFRPADISFIPRGFSFSHVNLTHRNWTAVGHPDVPQYPIVDPRGLVTPYFDGWSIDFWVVPDDSPMLVPAESENAQQQLEWGEERLSVNTRIEAGRIHLDTTVSVEGEPDGCETHIHAKGETGNGGSLVMALRPYNPEGIQFIDSVAYDQAENSFLVNGQSRVHLNHTPAKVLFSNYENGDVARLLEHPQGATSIACDMGMATAAALFPIEKAGTADIRVSLALKDNSTTPVKTPEVRSSASGWKKQLTKTATLTVPDEKIQFLYDAAVRTLLLLSADEVYPGPYTYKRFWFRDACLMIHALLGIGLAKRAARIVAGFPSRQTLTGYFQSQEGEWDSNGQVLWIAGRLHELTGVGFEDGFMKSIVKGADWINTKRHPLDTDKPHRGLLPAGFSAEHLGPNDHYYWDNFWGLAGLRAAARLAENHDLKREGDEFLRQAVVFEQRIMDSIEKITDQRRRGAIPASPYRRMDAGAVGSLVADYPLQLTPPNDPMVMNTVRYLMANCFHSGAFFQDMIHSGINAYLTLAIAQTLLRAGDPGYRKLVRTVADLASPTGQWPEAIHPFTKGGCMGDGQHGWAAAEWLMMIRNLFVREEGRALILGAGIFPEWIESGETLAFGPTLTRLGPVSIALRQSGTRIQLEVDIEHIPDGNDVIVAIPGYEPRTCRQSCHQLEVEPR